MQSVESTHTSALLALKAVSDSHRLNVLRALKSTSLGVQELAYIFELPQPGMSHHLKVLSQSGWIKARKEGNSYFYRRQLFRQDDPLYCLRTGILASLDLDSSSEPESSESHWTPLHQKRLKEVFAKRSQVSKMFFQRFSHQFAEKQAQITVYDHYQSVAEDLLDTSLPPRRRCALEVGPGEGQLLRRLQSDFKTVWAVDHSPAMLQNTQVKIEQSSDDDQSIQWLDRDFFELDAQHHSVDFLAMNMVLHHLPDPLQAFEQAYELLNEGGVFFLVDLTRHEQDWVREGCGDLWMGFESEELKLWGQETGFLHKDSVYVGLKNGFQVQLHTFGKLGDYSNFTQGVSARG